MLVCVHVCSQVRVRDRLAVGVLVYMCLNEHVYNFVNVRVRRAQVPIQGVHALDVSSLFRSE